MRKIFLLTILLFQLTFVFGQTEYGNWTPSPCYNYIQFQMKYNGKSSVQSGTDRVEQGWYSIRIRNTSPKKVALSYIVTMNSNREVLRHSSSTNTISTVRVEGDAPDTRLNPNEIIERDIYLTKTFQSVVYFEVWALKFESNNGATINELYENCSNGKPCMECQEHPNQMSCNSSSSTNKNTNQQTTQQNDLSEYNRSKADLERQMAEKNAEITRQNEENARLGQIWNNAIKAGVDAHNSGNYTEAKNQFTIAINNSTNETNRQNAQNYYDKSVEAEKSQAKIKVISEIAQGTIQIIGDAHEKKMQKLNAQLDESKRKLKIIDDDKIINTLTDSKIFETYVNYVTKNLEELNLKFEKIAFYSYIPNKEKNIGLNFEGLDVNITNRWDGSSMTKSIIFKFVSKNTYNNNITKTFFENLKLLDPFYDSFSTKLNSYEHSNFIVYGLEKTQSFVDVYKTGYNSNSYKGYVNQLNLFENIAKQKLNKNDSSVKGLVEKAELYKSGLNGVEKNNEKALELYQQAFDKSKDKEILLKIGQLYKENKNFEKAIISFENYINNNENINPIVYSNLGWIYKDDSSQFYDLNKAKYNFENEIKVLEENYNIENDEIKKAKLKKEISFTYSVLAFMYDYYGKNVTPNISVPYYEKTMLWNEDDDSTAFKLMRLYAKEWNTDNFKRDTKKAKYWALKVCEIAKRLEERNSGSHESKIAKMNCSTANDHISNNFKYLKK